jgi:cation diffusion facilitator family transporter
MHRRDLNHWQHHHSFGTQIRTRGERRTGWVVALTLAMMTVEIAAGTIFGSMALLADGWHMGTHAAALSVAVFAYVYARRHAGDPRYSFGTGKVGALGGFASATGLAVVALLIFGESAQRLASPVAIRFDEAIAVACVGLAVNVVCALLLREDHHHEGGPADHAHHDHNLRGAYLHVLADAITSLLAIAALSTGKLLGWTWMDPVMGLVGSVVIARWSYGLLRDTSRVLLDAEVPEDRLAAIHELDAAVEKAKKGDFANETGAPHNWDEARAYYHGERPECAPYATSEERGREFGTGSAVNQAILAAMKRGLAALEAKDAAGAAGRGTRWSARSPSPISSRRSSTRRRSTPIWRAARRTTRASGRPRAGPTSA